MLPLFGLPVGPELLVIVLLAVLLFGAQKIPDLARAAGEATGEFKQAKTEAEAELESVREDLEEQTAATTETDADASPMAAEDVATGN
jgi:sec-independent protein translocase protein TatA